jgi:hypothetical protein
MKYDFRCSCGDRWYGDCPAKTIEALKRTWAEFHGEHEAKPVEAGEQEKPSIPAQMAPCLFSLPEEKPREKP